ncbi:hypothetical protein BU25DRAFT_85663 [Macroventuria anomochaeta]|uniref:Uncharacterized protein n=1 Tax=Macroventuria anomochaeta TaxID=301207 RepID=A0ACB6SHV3_9PLEO|nr:uncharacterized protein BU25DRAFT_85663 [Macroventuria anomochaeta]KAF2632918.1 hypothetical protein BU25DRAFT_85663 [Macroventuria anomochaeta]
MSSTNIFSLEAPLPSSIKTYRAAYAEGSQHPVRAFSPSSSPHKYSQSHFARSRSSSPTEVAHSELNASSRLPNPRRFSKSQKARIAGSKKEPECIEALQGEALEYHECLQTLPTLPTLPRSAHNYQPYAPPAPPPILPWTRHNLYQQIINIAPAVFLSCNLTNPVHLASILAHGCEWDVVESVAQGMTPAVLSTSGSKVEGLLVGGLLPEAFELLEAMFRRRYGEKCERAVEEIDVRAEDGSVVMVPAYVFRKA